MAKRKTKRGKKSQQRQRQRENRVTTRDVEEGKAAVKTMVTGALMLGLFMAFFAMEFDGETMYERSLYLCCRQHISRVNKSKVFTMSCAIALLSSTFVTIRALSAQQCQEAILDLLSDSLPVTVKQEPRRRINYYLRQGEISLMSCSILGEAVISWRSKTPKSP